MALNPCDFFLTLQKKEVSKNVDYSRFHNKKMKVIDFFFSYDHFKVKLCYIVSMVTSYIEKMTITLFKNV